MDLANENGTLVSGNGNNVVINDYQVRILLLEKEITLKDK